MKIKVKIQSPAFLTISIYIFFVFLVTTLFRAQENIKNYRPDFQNLNKTQQPLNPDNLNVVLLENTLTYRTNLIRQNYHISMFISDNKLRTTARSHSKEMVRLKYLSHQSPNAKNRNLMDRLKNAGLFLGNTYIGENIGVDYFLGIAGVPFYKKKSKGKIQYINSKTGKPIRYHTYLEFAQRMLENWMKSPGHRKNILNKDFERIGIGIAAGTYKGFPAIYVTQHFIGALKLKKSK